MAGFIFFCMAELPPIETLSDESDAKPMPRRVKRGRSSAAPAAVAQQDHRHSSQLPPVDELTDDSSSHALDLKEMGLPKKKKKKKWSNFEGSFG